MASLFLDRDGVLNRRIPDGYVTRLEQFDVIPGVLQALALLAPRFQHIFVVTNQQGIGKGLMSHDNLRSIHERFQSEVQQAGGRIDHFYYCASLRSEHSFHRKPSIGMALQARHDYPGVRLHDSVMVGDTASDMLFGRRAGMQTVLVGDEPGLAASIPHLVDFAYPDLLTFAKAVNSD